VIFLCSGAGTSASTKGLGSRHDGAVSGTSASGGNLYFTIALLSLSMGMTNPALAKIGAESVSLTFVTGTLNRIGGHLASAAGAKTSGGGAGPRRFSPDSCADRSKRLERVSDRRSFIRSRGFKLSHVGPLASMRRHACAWLIQRVCYAGS
jgi:hypothetical protein